MARFQTVIKRTPFVYSPYTATEMQGFGQVLAEDPGHIKASDGMARIQSGQNIYDQSAPLKPGQSGRRGYPDGFVPRTASLGDT